ncbi:MAG: ABC transporter substrate-binding protein [Leucobacter sp.]
MTDDTRPSRLGRITRRGLLGVTAAAAAALMLAGCAGSAGQSGGATDPSTTEQQKGGVLRVAATDGANVDMDPHGTGAASAVKRAMFDALVEYDENMVLKPYLAEKFEPENPDDQSVWIIKVRDAKWHDGKPVTADDVEFTIRRIVEGGLSAASLMSLIDLDGFEKIDDKTLRVRLTAPNSQLPVAFTASYASLVPVGFDPAKPIGTGAFKFKSFTPGQRWEGERFDDYWRVDGGAYLDGLQVTSFDSSASALNALLAGQIDAIPNVLPAQLPQIESQPNLKTVESESGYIMMVELQSGEGAPFEDPRVREAFKLALDRQQLVDSVYSGYGDVANDIGVFPQFDKAAGDPPVRERDLDQAKKLLKEAGKENLKVKLRVGELIPGMTASAEIIQQQVAEAGIEVEIDKVTDIAQFYDDDYFTADLQVDYTDTITMYDGAYYWWLSYADYHNTGWKNDDFEAKFAEAITLPQEEYEKKMQEATQILYDDGPWAVWGRQNTIDVHTDKVIGIEPTLGRGFLNDGDFSEVSLVS